MDSTTILIAFAVGLGFGVIIGVTLAIKCLKAIVVRTVGILRGGK